MLVVAVVVLVDQCLLHLELLLADLAAAEMEIKVLLETTALQT
jgi:hypothetical protein